MRIEWVMQIDRGSWYHSLKQMTQSFCFMVFRIHHQEFPRGFSSKSRQAKTLDFLVSQPIVKLGTRADVPELSSPPQHTCPHLEQLVFSRSVCSAHTWSMPYVWQPQELSFGSPAEQRLAWLGKQTAHPSLRTRVVPPCP